jgi:hypothetical protein
MRPEVTSALAANAARSAVISSDSAFAATLVVVAGASVVVGAGTVVDATASVFVAEVEPASGATVSSDVVSPSAHAETTSTRTVSTMLMRLVTENPFGAE